MANNGVVVGETEKWNFKANETIIKASEITVRGVIDMVMKNINSEDPRETLLLGHGDPSSFPSYRTSTDASDAIVDALRTFRYNGYSHNIGVLEARKAVSEYLSRDLPYKLSEDDVYLTLGCSQALEAVLSAVATPGANVLLPRPGFPYYESRCAYIGLEARHFDLNPEKGWEVDLEAVEALADENTAAIVIINPGNPCGNVYSYEHLQKIAETAKKLGIFVIADEVYDHLTFGNKPFVPMGVFESIAPVITLGGISKRWIVPGWRLGWVVTNDTRGFLLKTGVAKTIRCYLTFSADPVTFIQGAIPQIIANTKEDFFLKIIDSLQKGAEIIYEKLKEIPALTCPHKPEGSMFVMVKINLALLDDIVDDLDFSIKLAKEEKTLVLPGMAVGLKNWLRMTFALEQSPLEEALERIKAFCLRHSKNQLKNSVNNGV